MTEETGTTRRKKSGFPSSSIFDNAQLVHSFSKISRALTESKTFPYNFKLDEQSLANVSFQLQTFMELSLGKSSPLSARTITKIPQFNFHDNSVDGSLMCMLKVALAYQFKEGWDVFNLTLPERFSNGVEIIRSIEALLTESRMLSRPRVFIGRVPASVANQMKTLILKHGGSIVETVSMASHVVDWDEEVDSLPSELTEEFVRTLEVRPTEDSGTALVHWFYHPDSYDEWIPSDHVDGSEPPDTVPQPYELHVDRQWHVCCRFVMDCEIFNEWGNEIDYENIPEGEGDDDDVVDDTNQDRSPVKASAGRKARGRRRLDAVKAKKVPILESITVTEKMMQDVPPPLLDSGLEAVSVLEMVSGSECVLKQERYAGNNNNKARTSPSIPEPEVSEGDADTAMVVEGEEDTLLQPTVGVKRKIDDTDDGPTESSTASTVKQKKEKNINRKPSYQSHLKLPAWYNSESLHALEMKYLPDFFADENERAKDTIEYFRIRNFIVSLYAHNPSVYLSATDCRRKLSGDVCAVLRIHSFLDAFGVINFHLKADCRPVLGQASVSRWSEELLMGCIANTPSNTASSSAIVSSTSGKDDFFVEWSEEMDKSLCQRAVADKGDWLKVSKSLAHLYSDGCSDGPWTPSPDDCLARFVSLGLPAPAFKGGMAEGAANLALTNIASSSKTQRMKFLASQIFDRAVHTLGKEGMRRAISAAALPSNSMKGQRNTESISANNCSEEDEDSVKLSEQITFRLDSLGKKMKLLRDVDREIDTERERIELDMRDMQMQRAQLCLQR